MAASRSRKKAPGFWETYKDEGAGKFLTPSEKGDLISNGTVVEILAVRYDEKNQFAGDPAPRYVVTLLVDGAERLWGFHVNEEEETSRDRLLASVAEYLDQDDKQAVLVQFEKVGQFVRIVKGD